MVDVRIKITYEDDSIERIVVKENGDIEWLDTPYELELTYRRKIILAIPSLVDLIKNACPKKIEVTEVS